MSVIIDETRRVIVQGITGREGRARTKLMLGTGTQVLGGCTPGKGGEEVDGLPVFNTVQETVDQLGSVDVSVIFVPARLIKAAAIEAIEAGIRLLVLVPDRVPLWDAHGDCRGCRESWSGIHRSEHTWRHQSGPRGTRHDRWQGCECTGLVQHADPRTNLWRGEPFRRDDFLVRLLPQPGRGLGSARFVMWEVIR